MKRYVNDDNVKPKVVTSAMVVFDKSSANDVSVGDW